MSKNFYISDLHLWHNNVTKAGKDFDGRPYANLAEMHEDIMKRWNSVVGADDHVYVLGDFVFIMNNYNKQEVLDYINKLNGRIHLIEGNHDKIGDSKFKKRFEEIKPYKTVTDYVNGYPRTIVLSHYYMPTYAGHYNGAILFHGHSHNSHECDFERQVTELAKKSGLAPLEIYNVGCMQPYMNYTPRTAEEIVNGYEEWCDIFGDENANK